MVAVHLAIAVSASSWVAPRWRCELQPEDLAASGCACTSQVRVNLSFSAAGGLVQQIFQMPYSRPVEIALLQPERPVRAGDIPEDDMVSGVSLSPGGGRNPVPSPALLGGFAALASREP